MTRIRRALSTLLEEGKVSADDAAIIRAALTGPPPRVLPVAVKAALATLAPARLIAHLDRLLQAGMPWMSETGMRRVQVLAAEHPRAGEVSLPGADLLDGPAEWRIYLAALGHPARVRPDEITPVLPRLPLAVVDDLIDLGVVGRDEEPWNMRGDAGERLYLRARLIPRSLSRDDARRLGWAELDRWHAFLAGEDLDGDDVYAMLARFWQGHADIRLRASLPPEQRPLFDEIMRGAQTGHWPAHITAERGFWALLMALWSPAGLINPKAGEFHAWRAAHQAYRWILARDLRKAREQAELLVDAARQVRGGRHLVSRQLRAEIHNMAAYLAQETEELDRAIRLLDEVADVYPEVTENIRRLKERRSLPRNRREYWENPYLMLGLPHGAPGWEATWRRLRKEFDDDLDRLTMINEAKRRLTHADRHGADFYVLPLEEKNLQAPRRRSPRLAPPLEPLPRRTQSEPRDFRMLRNAAARTLLDELRHEPRNP
ncbi:hypothetical protein [Thermobispora bispora]|uniref:Uncharacterized protein n=1 Tax=Thermobispora bispora (strain ATCC 19993 / DSM 43833 / CBS 139.67 / JCM 10125 / KCTC 9307 / NBRC 14880 / R51) TaxID=469371 RepID=D6YAP0_THEBD|nr:hypothetical protein [Thermobispora bispora]ADG88257.1 hypothetical protein Tbis_1542 [Thermobispora bispora DSM 43833]MDI9580971.1 hypothetical protein [Thermobispora sp.]